MLHALNRGATSVIPAVPENERNQTNIKFVSSAEDFKGIADMRSQGIKHLDVDDADKKVHDGPFNFSLSEEIMPRNGAFEEDVRLNLSLYHIGADYLLTYFKRNSEGVER